MRSVRSDATPRLPTEYEHVSTKRNYLPAQSNVSAANANASGAMQTLSPDRSIRLDTDAPLADATQHFPVECTGVPPTVLSV